MENSRSAKWGFPHRLILARTLPCTCTILYVHVHDASYSWYFVKVFFLWVRIAGQKLTANFDR